MSGSGECRLKGLCIKASPLGENDRLITILTDEQGIVRLAAPGAANLTIPCSSVRMVISLSFSPNGEALIQRPFSLHSPEPDI